MFALIYDTHELDKPKKRVLSVHKNRENAEKALAQRLHQLKKTVTECNTRIVWMNRNVKCDDFVIEEDFSTWKPGEKVPYGETHSDTD